MPGVVYDVDVYRLQLARMYVPGGEAYRWLDRVRLSMHRACVAGAPMRSGELKGAHRSFIRGFNQYRARAQIVNDAEHALWVHEGTTGPIFPKKGKFLYLPAGGGHPKKRLRYPVPGQDANPWIDDACSRIARRHGGITYG